MAFESLTRVQTWTRSLLNVSFRWKYAEREGFEPSVPGRAHSLSRGAHSTALAPLLEANFLRRKSFGRTFCKTKCFSPVSSQTSFDGLTIELVRPSPPTDLSG